MIEVTETLSLLSYKESIAADEGTKVDNTREIQGLIDM